MNAHDAREISAELMNATPTGPLQMFYDRGYRAGYAAGLQAALDIAQKPNVYIEPTCCDCGHPLDSGGECWRCGDA